MANSKKKCKHCKQYFPVEGMTKTPAGMFCTFDHALAFANDKHERERDAAKTWQDDFKKRVKEGEFKAKTRTEYLDILQDLVNQYILNVRDTGKHCCTCGATYKSVKFDAGHYRSRGACPELRFEPTNIHAQCYICNSHNSGMRLEYQVFIERQYGAEHLAWLNGPHKKLKEQFPDNQSIKTEAARYRKLIRAAGIQPRR
jgi:hypothetical protein